MGQISDYVDLQIAANSGGLTRVGFGTALFLSANADFVDRVRYYADLSEVETDFPSTTGPEYLAAQQLFSQDPAPDRMAIGRMALKPTKTLSLVALAARNSYGYALNVKGDGVTSTELTVTSDSSTSIAEVHSAVLTALNAVTGKNYTATFTGLVYADDTFTAATTDICTNAAHGLQTGDGPFQLTSSGTLPAGLALVTNYWIIRLDADTFSFASSLANSFAGTAIDVTDTGSGNHTISDTVSTVRPADPLVITGSAAGEWFSIEVTNVADFSVEETESDPGVATDLAAIKLENNDWYALYTAYNSNAIVLATAAWCEANEKLYIADLQETETVTLAASGSDTADDIEALGYDYTAVTYHPDPSRFFGMCLLGGCLPFDPGTETWALKELDGVEAVALTSTHKTNLAAKNVTSYESIGNLDITFGGKVASGEYIDYRRGLDALRDDMQASVFEVMVASPKVPMNDDGISMLAAPVRATLKRFEDRGFIEAGWTITKPLSSAISTSNRNARLLDPPIKFAAVPTGAVHKTKIRGSVSN